MSDAKPKRPARDAGQSDISPGETPVTAAAALAELPAPAAAALLEPPAPALPPPAEPAAVRAEDGWTAIAESQAALARGVEDAALELTGISRASVAAASDAAIALLGARTFAEALEINASLARRGLDTMIEGSAKLSEIGARAAAEAARPLVSRLGRSLGNFAAG